MITLDELNRLIGEHAQAHQVPAQTLKLTPQAFFDGTLTPGRVLAQDVFSALNYPLADQSAMDGYALATGSDLKSAAVFDVIGEQAAGEHQSFDARPGQAVRIFTGAWLPAGFDTVVMQENVTLLDSSDSHTLNPNQPLANEGIFQQISLDQEAKPFENVRRFAEEISAGERIFARGHRLSAFDIGLLAQLGLSEVSLYEKPLITILASGDELVEIGKPLAPAQLHNTNSLLIASLLSDLPVTLIDGGIVPDTLEACTEALITAARHSIVVITTGGVSAGDKDYFARALEQVGTLYQHKVAMKPGKPVLFGEIKRDQGLSSTAPSSNLNLSSSSSSSSSASLTQPEAPSPDQVNQSTQTQRASALYFGLPGNPVSSGITALKILIPALRVLGGEKLPTPEASVQLSLQASLSKPINHRPGRLEFVRGTVSSDAQGLSVKPLAQGSHRIKNMALANCLIEVPLESTGLASADLVKLELL